MKQERIFDLIRAQPFQPFDIKTSDGRLYRVDHPEFVARSRDSRTVVFFTDDDRAVFINVSQIVALEVANRAA